MNIEENKNFAPVDPFDFDLEGHKTIEFFLFLWVTFGCSIIRIPEKLWAVEKSQTHRHTCRDRQTGTQTLQNLYLHVRLHTHGDKIIIL